MIEAYTLVVNASSGGPLATTTETSSETLTKVEYRLLIDSVVPARLSIGNPRLILAFNLLVGVIVICWSLYASNYRMLGISAMILINALWLGSAVRQREVATGLIRKLFGDPSQGRRTLDATIPHELSEQ